MTPYPVVLLNVPLRAKGVERLAPLGAVGELEEAGECASVVGCIGEDGVLEVDAMGEDVIVLIHPADDINRKSCEDKSKKKCFIFIESVLLSRKNIPWENKCHLMEILKRPHVAPQNYIYVQ